MSDIFISYRRSDCLFKADRLSERLGRQFKVFRDIDCLPPAVDWGKTIESELAACAVQIVIIGKMGLQGAATSEASTDGHVSWFLKEIEEGLRLDVTILPVLVDGAELPSSAGLAPSLTPLLQRHCLTLSDQSWRRDVEEMIDRISPYLSNHVVGSAAESGHGAIPSHTEKTFFTPRLDFPLLVDRFQRQCESERWQTAIFTKAEQEIFVKIRPRKGVLSKAASSDLNQHSIGMNLELREGYLVAVLCTMWWDSSFKAHLMPAAKRLLLFGAAVGALAYPPARKAVTHFINGHPVVTGGGGSFALAATAHTAEAKSVKRRETFEQRIVDLLENLVTVTGGVSVKNDD